MKELFNSRGIFILGDLQYIRHNVNYKSGEITLDNNTISFQYDKDKSFHRLRIVEIKDINYLSDKSSLELIDILGLAYRYAPTCVVEGKTVIDNHKLDILANLMHQVQAQSTPIIVESEFQFKQIQKGRAERVIIERESREQQQFHEQMETIFAKLRNEKVKKLAKILYASNALNIDIFMDVLKIDSSTFYNDIIPIAVDYGFKLDGDIMTFEKMSVPEFIYKLTNYFFLLEQKAVGQKLTIKKAKLKPKPKPKKKAEEEKEKVPLSAEELEEERKTSEVMEKEVKIQREKFVCVVHKGPIEGDNYLCPNCFTFYCVKCATALKQNGEDCWTCGTEIDIKSGPSLPLETLQEIKKLEAKMNTLKKTAIDLDESFYAGALESEEHKKIKESIVERILKLSSEIAQMKKEKVK